MVAFFFGGGGGGRGDAKDLLYIDHMLSQCILHDIGTAH